MEKSIGINNEIKQNSNNKMRRLNFKVALACMACLAGMTFFGCTNEEDETATENNQRVERLKNKILELADDYGLENIQIDEKELRENKDINENDIECSIKELASVMGNYKIVNESHGALKLVPFNSQLKDVKRKIRLKGENNVEYNDSAYTGDVTVTGSYDFKSSLNISLSFSYKVGSS